MRALVTIFALCAALLVVPLAGSAQAGEYTRIVSADGDSGECLGISNNGTGSEVLMVPCVGKAWEYWLIDTLSSGAVRLRSAAASAWNKCVDASRGKAKQLIMVRCDGSANQAFIRRTILDPLYTLESVRYRGQCVDIKDWGRSDIVQLWDCHGDWNQRWWHG